MENDVTIQLSEHFEWKSATDKISDKRDLNWKPPSFEDAAVDIYDDRQVGWFLEPLSERYLNGRGSVREDYIVVATLLAYFEGSEQFREGKSSKFGVGGRFKKAAARVLNLPSKSVEIERLWGECRCGLFHAGFTYSKVFVKHDSTATQAISTDHNGYLCIEPYLLLTAVWNDHKAYVSELRANPKGKLWKNFQKLWKEYWDNS